MTTTSTQTTASEALSRAFAQHIEVGSLCAAELHASDFTQFDEGKTNVTVLEAAEPTDVLTKYVFQDVAPLRAHWSASKPALRIISIPQEDSYEPLQISKAGMGGILKEHNVSPDFLTVLLAAGAPPRESEAGFGYPLENVSEDGSFSLAYLFRYPEKRRNNWHIRQTGVYHGYSKTSNSNLFLVLFPMELKDSAFQKQLEAHVERSTTGDCLAGWPMAVHRMLFESYIGNWRSFLCDQGKLFIKSADKLFALDYKEEHYRDISFEKLQWWRDLEDRIIPCATILEATLVTLDAFDRAQKLTQSNDNRLHQGINAAPDVKFSYFRSRKALVEALRLSASGLRQRIHGALNLLESTLELKNANELKKVNTNLLSLQKENVEDNETVKVITILTLIYLPGSFVATLLGTNLFFLNPKTSKMRIADNWWWYAVLFVPLMAITIASWQLARRSSHRKREAKAVAWQAFQNAVAADGSIELQQLQAHLQNQLQQQA